MRKFNITRDDIERPADTIGLTTEITLPELGNEGRIDFAAIREHIAPNNEALTGDLYIVDGLPDATAFAVATCPESACCYISRGLAFTGSATLDSDQDNVADRGGANFKLRNGCTALRVILDILTATGGGGESHFDLTLRGEVG